MRLAHTLGHAGRSRGERNVEQAIGRDRQADQLIVAVIWLGLSRSIVPAPATGEPLRSVEQRFIGEDREEGFVEDMREAFVGIVDVEQDVGMPRPRRSQDPDQGVTRLSVRMPTNPAGTDRETGSCRAATARSISSA